MNKQEIYAYLQIQNIEHEITEHPAIFNMEEMAKVALPYPAADAKNLFVRDDKKRHYYLITVKDNKHVDLKEFRHRHQTRPLSFASENDLMAIMGLTQGSVTPLGIRNDAEHKICVYLDEAFMQPPQLIGVHPNDNTATVWLKTQDLIHIIKAHGNPLHLVKI